MYTIRTKIAIGGFLIAFATPIPSKAHINYFVVGSGGRQASGSVSVNGSGEKFVHMDFPVLTVGVTDLEILEASAIQESHQQHNHDSPMPAVLKTLAEENVANRSLTDPSLTWRREGIQARPYADSLNPQGLFVASGG
jgi:hypothetical protein